MAEKTAEEIDSNLEELEQIVRAIAVKHNDLVVSVSLVWAEVQRGTTDPLTKHICARRLEEMRGLLYENAPVDRHGLSSLPLTANEYEESRPASYD